MQSGSGPPGKRNRDVARTILRSILLGLLVELLIVLVVRFVPPVLIG